MKKIVLLFLIIFWILILSACNSSSTSENQQSITTTNVENDMTSDSNKKNTYTTNQLAEYLSIGIKRPTVEKIVTYINDIDKKFQNVKQRIIEKDIGNYVVFEVIGDNSKALCLWEKNSSTGEILNDDNMYSIKGIIKDKYLIVESVSDALKNEAIYDLSSARDNQNFKSEIKIYDKFYDINNTNWIVYQRPTSNKNVILPTDKAMDIDLYNLNSKEQIIYKRANNNYDWKIDSNEDNRLEIIKEEWDAKHNAKLESVLYLINDIIDNRFLVVDNKADFTASKTFYDLKNSNTNEEIKSDFILTTKFYNMKDTGWIIYQFPTSNTNINIPIEKATDILLYNLYSKENLVFRQAENNYGWKLEKDEDNKLRIIKVEWDGKYSRITVNKIKDLNNWLGDDYDYNFDYGEEIEQYFSKRIGNPTDENIKKYISQFPEVSDNLIIDIKDEYENNKYFVFQISEIVPTEVNDSFVGLWEKGNPSGGHIIQGMNCGIEKLLEDKYLVVDSGTWTIRGKSIYNLSLDISDNSFSHGFNILMDRVYNFTGTDWIIYSTPTDNDIENMPIDELCDIELYNLKTNERILYKEAKDNYIWFLETSTYDNNLLAIIKDESNENNELKSTVVEYIDLNNWSAMSSKLKE